MTRSLLSHEAKIVKIMSEHQMSDTLEFSRIRAEMDQQGDSIRYEFGETGRALRQGIHNLEVSLAQNQTHNLETFARRQSMYDVNKEMSTSLKELVEKVDNLGIQVAKLS